MQGGVVCHVLICGCTRFEVLGCVSGAHLSENIPPDGNLQAERSFSVLRSSTSNVGVACVDPNKQSAP